MDKHDTVGLDLRRDGRRRDLVVCGAEPLFCEDYIAVGRTVPGRVSAIVAGYRRRLRDGRLCLLGRGDRGTSRADGTRPLRHRRPPVSASSRPTTCSDPTGSGAVIVIIAMGPRGLHSSGYSLARKVLLEIDRMSLERTRRGVRPHPRRGTARARPHLRQGLLWRWPPRRSPHLLPRHRRRSGGNASNCNASRCGLVAELDRGTWTPHRFSR